MRPFEKPALSLGKLDAEAAGRLIAAAADVALILDDEGIIRDVAFGSDELSRQGCEAWLSKPWIQTVTVESRPKVEALLREVAMPSGSSPRWRHVNHVSPDGPDLPMMYSAMSFRSGGRTGTVGRTIAFGRDLRPNAVLQQRLVAAQQSMERDYWRLRHLETRYRSLFQLVSEAVLIIDAATMRLEDANPAAERLFGEGLRRASWSLPDRLETASATALRDLLFTVRATGRGADLRVRLADGQEELDASVSLFRQESSTHFLVRLSPLGTGVLAAADDGRGMLPDLMEHAPDAFAVTDPDGRVLMVNRAFLDLAQLPGEAMSRGQMLDRWLGRTGVDFNVLLTNLRQLGSVRLFSTVMRGEFGSVADVEISAVAVQGGEQPCLGFTVRDVGRRLGGDARGVREVPRSVGQMTELVGRVPLKEIVRDTTDLIEQLCIEAALELTHDNRASAAEMLGLSRQSLYVKLRRFNIGDAAADPDEPAEPGGQSDAA